MNKRGQALVEFIIIIPIIIFMLLAFIDYSTMSNNKNKMENIMGEVVSMYKENHSLDEIKNMINKNDKNIIIDIYDDNDYTKIILKKEYKFITPGMDKIFNDSNVLVEREIYNEKGNINNTNSSISSSNTSNR